MAQRTGQYAERVRAAAYAATRGAADFAAFSSEIARVLNEIATIADPSVRLAIAEKARQSLADWPGTHYGYRVTDVRESLGMLDDIIAELRSAVGQTRFDLSLTAPLTRRATSRRCRRPATRRWWKQLVTAASLAETPSERIRLLQAGPGDAQ